MFTNFKLKRSDKMLERAYEKVNRVQKETSDALNTCYGANDYDGIHALIAYNVQACRTFDKIFENSKFSNSKLTKIDQIIKFFTWKRRVVEKYMYLLDIQIDYNHRLLICPNLDDMRKNTYISEKERKRLYTIFNEYKDKLYSLNDSYKLISLENLTEDEAIKYFEELSDMARSAKENQRSLGEITQTAVDTSAAQPEKPNEGSPDELILYNASTKFYEDYYILIKNYNKLYINIYNKIIDILNIAKSHM